MPQAFEDLYLAEIQQRTHEDMLADMADAGMRTPDGRRIVQNPDGTVSSERTITVTDPRLNSGRPTNIPTMFDGAEVSQDDAIRRVIEAGGADPETGRPLSSFNTVDDAERAARERSSVLGAQRLAVEQSRAMAEQAAATPPIETFEAASQAATTRQLHQEEFIAARDQPAARGALPSEAETADRATFEQEATPAEPQRPLEPPLGAPGSVAPGPAMSPAEHETVRRFLVEQGVIDSSFAERTNALVEAVDRERRTGIPLQHTPAFPRPRDRFPELAGAFGAGFLGALRDMANALPALEAFVGVQTPFGNTAQDLAVTLNAAAESLPTADDPDFVDRFTTALGSSVAFFGPGIGTSVAVRAIGRAAPQLARVLGASASAFSEAGAEAGGIYEELRGTLGEQEAGRRANDVFWKNAVLLGITNRLGVFGDQATLVGRAIGGAISEGVQEAVQYDVQRRHMWLPGDTPAAENLLVQGWVREEETDRLILPFNIASAAEAAAIGALLGGVAGPVAETLMMASPEAVARFEDVLRSGAQQVQALAQVVNNEIGAIGHQLPDSKVRDDGGKLIRVFHGTTAVFERFQPEQADTNALYGPGFYHTEDAAIAGGQDPQSRQDLGYASTLEEGQAFLPEPKVFLSHAEAERFVTETFGEEALERGSAQITRNIAAPSQPVTFRVFRRETFAPNVHPAYLDIRQPFDIEKTYQGEELETLKEVLNPITDGSFSQFIGQSSSVRGQEVYNHLGMILAEDGGVESRNNEQANNRLQQAGFDGITHMGGGITGGQPHRVWIAFRPEQVVPAFSLMDALRNERGAVNLFGQEQPEGEPTPAEQPGLPAEPTEIQPSPEQLGFEGVPQQTTFQLSPTLQGAQVNAGRVPLTFDNDLDKAFYIIGNPRTRSANHEAYVREVVDFLRVPESDAMRQAQARREQIMQFARDRGQSGTPLQVPAGDLSLPIPPPPPPGAIPTDQLEMPLIGTDDADMQGLPVLSQESALGLRAFLRMIEEERAQMLEIDGKPLEINYRHIQTDEGIKQVLSAISEIYLDDVAKIRQPRSHDETREAAQKLNLTIEQFLETDRENLVSRRKAILGREMAVASARQLKVATGMFKSGTLSGKDLLRTFAVHSAIQMQFARLANEAGGALSIFNAPVAGDLTSLKGFEKMMEYLGSRGISETKLAELLDQMPTPEQLSLLVEQGPPAMARDVFLELWYGLWLLSNPKTHVVNFMGTGAMIPLAITERAIAARLPGRTLPLDEAMRRSMLAESTELTRRQKRQIGADATALFQRDVYRGEANAMWYALWRTMGDAWRLAGLSFKLGEGIMSPRVTAEGLEAGAPDTPQTAEFIRQQREAFIAGEPVDLRGLPEAMPPATTTSDQLRSITRIGVMPIGRAGEAVTAGPLHYAWDALGVMAKTVSNGLTAADEFFKALNFQMARHAMAYRMGVERGLFEEGAKTGDVADTMHELMKRMPDGVEPVLIDEMNERTFTRPTDELGIIGKLGSGVTDAANMYPILRVWTPFVRTPVNITHSTMERFPLTAMAMRRVREDMAAGGARRDIATAKMMLGGLTGLVIAAMGPLGLGIIRGEGEPERDERKALEDITKRQRYSLRVPWGETHLNVSFFRFDPLSQYIGFLTDWARRGQDAFASGFGQQWLEVGAAGLWALSRNITNRNYMQGLHDFMKLVFDDEDKDPEVGARKWERWVNQQASRFVPAGVGALEQALDPQLTEVMTAWEALKSRVPWTEKTPRLDFFGNPVTRPSLNPLVDLINPFPVAVELDDPVVQEMVRQGANLNPPNKFLMLPRRPQEGPEDESLVLRPPELNRLRILFAKEFRDNDGNNLKEALQALIASGDYQEAVGGQFSRRTDLLNRKVGLFKRGAKHAFLAEGDDSTSVQHETVQIYRMREGLRRGRKAPPGQAQEIINRTLERLSIGGAR